MAAMSNQKGKGRTPLITRPPSFASILDAPSKQDRLERLQLSLDKVTEENRELRQRLAILESRMDEMMAFSVKKASEVESKLEVQTKDVAAHISSQVESRVSLELRERHLQQKNALKVRIGGLPKEIDTGTSSEQLISIIDEAAPQVNFGFNEVDFICNQTSHFDGERIPSGHVILIFKKAVDRVRLLQQSRLLKDTKIWMAEELTLAQLKSKGAELKKVADARAKGKWAVYRGGRAIIQEFRTPKPMATASDLPVEDPPTSSPLPSPTSPTSSSLP